MGDPQSHSTGPQKKNGCNWCDLPRNLPCCIPWHTSVGELQEFRWSNWWWCFVAEQVRQQVKKKPEVTTLDHHADSCRNTARTRQCRRVEGFCFSKPSESFGAETCPKKSLMIKKRRLLPVLLFPLVYSLRSPRWPMTWGWDWNADSKHRLVQGKTVICQKIKQFNRSWLSLGLFGSELGANLSNIRWRSSNLSFFNQTSKQRRQPEGRTELFRRGGSWYWVSRMLGWSVGRIW